MGLEEFVFALLVMFLIFIGLVFFGFKIICAGTVGALERHINGMKSAPTLWMSAFYILSGILLLSGAILAMNLIIVSEIPPPIKLIVLDIDGVLNHNKAPKRINVSHLYDPECIDRLNKLIKHQEAKLVICSAWRIGQNIESMQEILDSIGVKGEVIGLTPWYRGYHTRDDEITAWLQEYQYLDEIKGIVLIDDDSSERFAAYQVKPSWEEFGLRWEHVKQADAILNRKMPDKFDIGKVSICESVASKETNFGGHHLLKKPSTTSKQDSKS